MARHDSDRTQEITEKLEGLLENLAKETDKVRFSDCFRQYLGTIGRFHTYSLGNRLLIALQRPDATRVAGYHTWLKLRRHVLKGQKAIWILRPYTAKVTDEKSGEKATKVVGFGAAAVFDLAQTDGDPLPELGWKDRLDGDYSGLFAQLVAACTARGIVVEREEMAPSRLGYSSIGRIALNNRQSESDLVPTLIHEVGHEVLHTIVERREFSTQQKEAQAEATAWAVCNALGIECPNSPAYMALYGVTAEVLRANLEAIARGTSAILAMVHGDNSQAADSCTCEETNGDVGLAARSIPVIFGTDKGERLGQ